jgi:hypothetical protein
MCRRVRHTGSASRGVMMPEYCTCGAELPADALFCHKCGKPQREIVVPERDEPAAFTLAPPPAPEPASVAQPVTFRNPIAMRIALLVALGSTVLVGLLPFLNWIAGGFLAVLFYRRKTGGFLSVRTGVQLGWITGLAAFVLGTVLFTIQYISAIVTGKLAAQLQESMRGFPINDPVAQQQAIAMMQSGAGLVIMLLVFLSMLFLFIIGLSVAGGALGAKLVGRGPELR